MSIRRLPKIYGFTVDIRLKEFRKILNGSYKFISFDSERGQKLLKKIKKNGLSKPAERLK